MKLIYARDAVWTPWKNGGGVTRQIAAWPERSGLDDFGWRISTARIDASGPFSHFAGIDRTLAVIEGILDFYQDGQIPVQLTAEGPAVSFAGETPVEAGPAGGTVTDFNLMTRRGQYTQRLWRRRLVVDEQLRIAAERDLWTTIYVIHGQCRIESREQSSSLRTGDAAVVSEVGMPVTLSGIADADLLIAEVRRGA